LLLSRFAMLLLFLAAPLRCATTSTPACAKAAHAGDPGPAAQGIILSIFETVRLKSYPVTREWPAKRVVARAVSCLLLSLRCCFYCVASLCCCSFCRFAALRDDLHPCMRKKSGARRGPRACGARNCSLLFLETVRLKSYPVTCEWSAKRVVARTVYCCFLSLCCCSFCRFAAPSAALRVSACGLKLEDAKASTPECAKAAHAGDPGACGSKELIF
jgi:hypothetical protein